MVSSTDTCRNSHPWDEGNTYVHPTTGVRLCRECRRFLALGYRQRHQEAITSQRADFNMGGTEKDVWQLVSIGLSNQEIANVKRLTLKSVEHVMNSLYGKLGLEGDGNSKRVRLARMWRP